MLRSWPGCETCSSKFRLHSCDNICLWCLTTSTEASFCAACCVLPTASAAEATPGRCGVLSTTESHGCCQAFCITDLQLSACCWQANASARSRCASRSAWNWAWRICQGMILTKIQQHFLHGARTLPLQYLWKTSYVGRGDISTFSRSILVFHTSYIRKRRAVIRRCLLYPDAMP